MRVKDVMSERIERTDADATVREAAEHLKRTRCGAVWVMDGDRAAGAVTDQTMTTVVAQGSDPESVRVRDVMDDNVCLLPQEQTIADARRTLDEHRTCTALVVAEGGRFVGMVHRNDLPATGGGGSGQVMGFSEA